MYVVLLATMYIMYPGIPIVNGFIKMRNIRTFIKLLLLAPKNLKMIIPVIRLFFNSLLFYKEC